jgi:hypothetical protein
MTLPNAKLLAGEPEVASGLVWKDDTGLSAAF